MQDPRQLGMMGKKAMQLGNYQDAVRIFSMGLGQVQLLGFPPQWAAPFFLDRAECFWRLGDVQASMQDMEESLRHGLPRDDVFAEVTAVCFDILCSQCFWHEHDVLNQNCGGLFS